MAIKEEKFNKLLKKEEFEKAINITKKEYRPYDPGAYMYKLLINDKNNKFSDKHIELIYTTLISWNMNSRRAGLSDFSLFKKSILKCKKNIKRLEKYKIEKLNDNDIEKIEKELELLFNILNLVKTKSKLVTYSKTLHFLLPKLFVPIDRKYTLNFFYNNENIDTNKNPDKNNKNQLKKFIEIWEKYIELSKKHNLNKYLDKKWNLTQTKVLDNAVIGYTINHWKKERNLEKI